MKPYKKPPFRRLQGYAFDPSLSNKIDTAAINHMIYKIMWEENLQPGPKGEYIEVIDYDPTVSKHYDPVDLNDPYLLAQDGLDPSESNPHFHQQMVYAVAMTTIKNFESALGRPVLWSQRTLKQKNKGYQTEYVKTLRIYPHALRDANAFYSPQKKALLFGYFSSQPAEPTIQMPETLIFTCLSHDIIAHETTHAILDGIHKHYIEDTNPDVLAFHEAFADMVALFQHFTFPEVLKNQIAKTRGDLASQNLLGQLAQEFGSAIGKYGSLRDAIGYTDPVTKQWKAIEPNGDEYQTVMEPHARGAILVSAVFDAFLTIYKNRIADLLRIASNGTGILPLGELHPDLVNRLAYEASKSAGHILKMCIRAIDYCPPVDITFGDYLRAIITADNDLVSNDNRDYRIAFVDAFRKRGIYPEGIRSLSVESLQYPSFENYADQKNILNLIKFLRRYSTDIIYAHSTDTKELKDMGYREKLFTITRNYITGKFEGSKNPEDGLYKTLLHEFKSSEALHNLTGLNLKVHKIETDLTPEKINAYWIQSLYVSSRVGPSGSKSNQVIITLIQNAVVGIDDNNKIVISKDKKGSDADSIVLTGGVTLIFDLDHMTLQYAISKPLMDRKNPDQLDQQRSRKILQYLETGETSEFNRYFRSGKHQSAFETFSFLHNH